MAENLSACRGVLHNMPPTGSLSRTIGSRRIYSLKCFAALDIVTHEAALPGAALASAPRRDSRDLQANPIDARARSEVERLEVGVAERQVCRDFRWADSAQ